MDRGRFRVLLVDDDKTRRDLYGEYLSGDCTVVLAGPEDAVGRFLEERQFDLVICEHEMASVNGLSVLERWHQLCPKVNRVVISSLSAPDQLLWSLSHGHAQRYISRTASKTVTKAELLQCANEVRESLETTRPDWLLMGHPSLVTEVATKMTEEGERVSTSFGETLSGETLTPKTVLFLAPRSVTEIQEVTSFSVVKDLSLLVAVDRENIDLATDALLEGAMDVIYLSDDIEELSRQAIVRKNCHEWRKEADRLRRDLNMDGQVNSRPPIVAQVVDDIIGGDRGLDAAMAELEAAVIAEALEKHNGNRSAAARQLKLPRQTLQDRMKKHGIWTPAS